MYSLQPYKGKKTRHTCPQCGDKHSFALYVDEQGNMIDVSVGRCNHESGCGYHRTPKDWFSEHPSDNFKGREQSLPPVRKVKELCTIPVGFMKNSASFNSNLIEFLCSKFEDEPIEKMVDDYALGATKNKETIFWQIDVKGRVRTGKIIPYNNEDGHRIKDKGVKWTHSILKQQGKLPEDWELTQCLFGEHLLKAYPDKAVAIVESEKSAVIGSMCFPDYNWLATGGKSQLSVDKMKVLSGKDVVMFPDVDGFNEWTEKAKQFTFCRAVVSDILERNATLEEREAKIDIADWMLSEAHLKVVEELSESERLLQSFVEKNPCLGDLISIFGLKQV